MIKIAHTADVHLGYAQYGSKVRLTDFFNTFKYIIDYCINDNISILLVSGDILTTSKPNAEVLYNLYNLVSYANKNKLTIAAIDGNHDLSQCIWLRLCGIVAINDEVKTINGVPIAGLGYKTKLHFKEELHKLITSIKDKYIPILMLHQGLFELIPYDDGYETSTVDLYNTFSELGTHIGYVALGHIHEPRILEYNNLKFAYPGSPDFTEISLNEYRRFYSLTFDDELKLTKIEDIPVPSRHLVLFEVQSYDDLEKLKEVVKESSSNMLIVSYNRELLDIKTRLSNILQDTLHVITPAKTKNIITYNKEEATTTINITNVIKKTYAENTEEYVLITELLQNPENLKRIVYSYLQNKGVKVQ